MACIVEIRNTYKVLVEKPVGKRLVGRHRRRWHDNIKRNAKETGYEDRMAGSCEDGNDPSDFTH